MNTIGLIGCGNMGGAMLSAWLDALPEVHFYVVDRHAIAEDFGAGAHVTMMRQAGEGLRACDIVVMAVKPQVMKECAAQIMPFLNDAAVIMSVAAGLSFDALLTCFGDARQMVRVMPNTPAKIRKGMSVAMASEPLNDASMTLICALCDALGDTLWIDDEALFNAMGVINGCGPAYVYHMIEVLTQAGVEVGVQKEDAARLARQTVIGAAALAEQSAEPPEVLRENVTSKGGTTQAALDVLMDGRMSEIYVQALSNAIKRADALNH